MSPNLGKAKKYMTPYQAQTLLRRYETNPYLELGERHQLAQSLNISEERITEWFVQRRSWQRRSGMLHDGE